MGQRILNCPSCNARVEVPDNYFRANIACFQCGTQLDRRTGELASSGHAASPGMPAHQAQPQYAPQQQAPQQYAQPAQYGAGYPQYGQPQQYAAYQQTKSGKPVWMILLFILIPVGVVGILALAAIPLITSGGVTATGTWHKHSDPAGAYEIEFPKRPKEGSERITTGVGLRTYKNATCMAGLMYFEAAWYDMGPGSTDEYVFDYREAAQGMLEGTNGRIKSQKPYMVGKYKGSLVVMEEPGAILTTALMVRRTNRVHIIVVENHDSSDQAIVDRFIKSFKLTE